jgi:hypothetical protein
MSEGNMGWQLQTLKYDMMRDYRNTIPVEQQDQIWEEVLYGLKCNSSYSVSTFPAAVFPPSDLFWDLANKTFRVSSIFSSAEWSCSLIITKSSHSTATLYNVKFTIRPSYVLTALSLLSLGIPPLGNRLSYLGHGINILVKNSAIFHTNGLLCQCPYMYLSITDDLQVGETLETRDKQMRKVAAKKAFARPVKKL